MPLTASERSLAARRAALIRHSRGTGPETTAAAVRGAFLKYVAQAREEAPGLSDQEYHIRAERLYRAEMARRAQRSLAKRRQ